MPPKGKGGLAEAFGRYEQMPVEGTHPTAIVPVIGLFLLVVILIGAWLIWRAPRADPALATELAAGFEMEGANGTAAPGPATDPALDELRSRLALAESRIRQLQRENEELRLRLSERERERLRRRP
ncbi:MAG: hypothetical protein K9N49_03875 [Candidatus Marinimicrobia bacterium]|nr:hypothetical protein [Candidatus Neomarinimicrobiota bacterium]